MLKVVNRFILFGLTIISVNWVFNQEGIDHWSLGVLGFYLAISEFYIFVCGILKKVGVIE